MLNQRVKWIVFHGGYDFAYLLKMVHGEGLPESVEQFYALMRIYYPNIYDLKYFIKDHPNLKDVGLTKLAAEIGVRPFRDLVQPNWPAASGRKRQPVDPLLLLQAPGAKGDGAVTEEPGLFERDIRNRKGVHQEQQF